MALQGPLFQLSIGALTAWKIGVTAYLLAALMSIFTVVRRTRADEESGRLELVGATVIGRWAPLTAAVLTAVLANAGIAVVTAGGMAATGLPLAGSFALGVSIALVGLEPLLATPVGRIRWALSHLAFAWLGTALLLAGLRGERRAVYGTQIHDVGGQLARLTGAALVQLPAAWVLAGLGVALFGLSSRLAALAWASLITSVMIFELGAILRLSHWVVDVSPFAYVPKLPGTPFAGTQLLWLTGISAILGVGGLAAFRRRDLA